MNDSQVSVLIIGSIVFWVLLCWPVGAWNQRKGNDFRTGFLLAFLLSPVIGAIIVAATRENKKVLAEEAEALGEMKKCPYCAELVKRDAIKCRYCGSELPVAAPKKK